MHRQAKLNSGCPKEQHRFKGASMSSVQGCCALMLKCSRAVCSAKAIGVNAQTSKAEFWLPEGTAQVQRGFTGFRAKVSCVNAEVQKSGMQCKSHRCDCTDKQV